MSARAYVVPEQTSGTLSFRLKLATGDPLPASSLTSATLKVWVDNYPSNRGLLLDSVNVLNDNDVTIDSNGLLTWSFSADDMRMVSTARSELHIAKFKFRWDSNQSGLEHWVRFTIHRC